MNNSNPIIIYGTKSFQKNNKIFVNEKIFQLPIISVHSSKKTLEFLEEIQNSFSCIKKEENKKKITVRKRCDADTFRQRLIRLFRNDDDDEDDDYEEDRLLVDLIYRLLDPNPKSRMHVNRVQNDHAYVCVTHSLFSLLSQLIQIATLVQVLQWTVSLEKQNFYN